MEKLAFPADIAPDILNHWSSWPGALDKPLEPCLPNIKTPRPKKATLARTGSQNGRTTLDEIDVCFMRSMHKIWGLSIAEISRRRKVPSTTVRDIIRRRTWTHV
jgi:hypothetical protein